MSQPIPSHSPTNTFLCFACNTRGDKIFAKVNRGTFQYVLCKPECLAVALERLGLVNGTDRNTQNTSQSTDRLFKSPVNISVRNSPSAFVNSDRSPLQRSPGSATLNTIQDDTESDEDTPSLVSDNDIKQVQKLGKRLFQGDDS